MLKCVGSLQNVSSQGTSVGLIFSVILSLRLRCTGCLFELYVIVFSRSFSRSFIDGLSFLGPHPFPSYWQPLRGLFAHVQYLNAGSFKIIEIITARVYMQGSIKKHNLIRVLLHHQNLD